MSSRAPDEYPPIPHVVRLTGIHGALTRVAAFVVGLVAADSCTSGTGPKDPAKLVVTGGGQTDTIGAVLQQLLTVQVTGHSGSELVQFSSIPVDSGPQLGQGEATLGPPDGLFFQATAVDSAKPGH